MKALHLAVAIAAILLLATPEGLDSCGIAPPLPVFVTLQRPADEIHFLNGKLGVLRRTYQPRYLIGAFRVLSGIPLTGSEIDALQEPSASTGFSYSAPSINAWIAARQAVPGIGAAPAIGGYKNVSVSGFLVYFENCKTDAFATATATLHER